VLAISPPVTAAPEPSATSCPCDIFLIVSRQWARTAYAYYRCLAGMRSHDLAVLSGWLKLTRTTNPIGTVHKSFLHATERAILMSGWC
jgi:hypothetical protein